MGYLAPELREGGVIARSADLYSLGVIIIEILTGQKGYQATEDVIESWIDRLDRSKRDTICEQIRVCYETALECRDFNPKKRPTSARKIIDRLHERESIQVSNRFVPRTSSSLKKLGKGAIGIVEVDILGARGLAGMKNPYCVAKYGQKWVRTGTLFATAAPQWNEQYSWDVFDVSTVVAVAVFNDCRLSSHAVHGDAKDQRMGKVRIRLATLESGRVYTHYYPLMVLTPSGLERTGELHLAVRFTCKSWVKMLAMYGKPDKHHADPISMPGADYLQVKAMQMVATRLAKADPPLRKEVVEYMLDVDSHVFSMRRSNANFYRITSLFSGAVAAAKIWDDIRKWENPLTTILVHVVFLYLVYYPRRILPLVFVCIFLLGAWNYWRRPQTLPHMDTVLSYADQAQPDELDEEFDTFPTSRPDDIVQMRYDRLRSVAGMLDTVVHDLAMKAERAQSLVSWRDARLTPFFITLSLVVAVVLYLTPFQVVAMVMGLYFLRPKWLRSRSNLYLLFNLYSRLPSKEDMVIGSGFGLFRMCYQVGSSGDVLPLRSVYTWNSNPWCLPRRQNSTHSNFD